MSADDFRREILERVHSGSSEFQEIRAGDITDHFGGENANCCGAMRTLFRLGDQIIGLPKGRTPAPGGTFQQQTSGQNHQGANLVIRYRRSTDRANPA